MSYPNAAKGIKKVFVSEILQLIAYAVTIVAGFIALVSFVGASKNMAVDSNASATLALVGVAAAVLLLAGIVAMLVASIINIVGIAQSAKDESTFKMAILFVIMAFATEFGSVMLANVQASASSFLHAATGLFNLLAYIMVIGGIVRIADRLNRSDISAVGNTIFKLVIAVQLIGLLTNLTASILTLMGLYVDPIMITVLLVIAQVLSLIQGVMYLVFLGRARKMFAK